MTDPRLPRALGRRTLAGSAAVLAAAGALSAIRAENDATASAATGPVPATTAPVVRAAAWTSTPLATAASAGHRKHKRKTATKPKATARHRKARHKRATHKPEAVAPAPAPAPAAPAPTTPSV